MKTRAYWMNLTNLFTDLKTEMNKENNMMWAEYFIEQRKMGIKNGTIDPNDVEERDRFNEMLKEYIE